MRILIIRKPGPTDLTYEEKNSADYRYHPEDDSILRNFVEQELKKKMTKKELVGYYNIVQEFKKFYLPIYKQLEKEGNSINATRVNYDFNSLLMKYIGHKLEGEKIIPIKIKY